MSDSKSFVEPNKKKEIDRQSKGMQFRHELRRKSLKNRFCSIRKYFPPLSDKQTTDIPTNANHHIQQRSAENNEENQNHSKNSQNTENEPIYQYSNQMSQRKYLVSSVQNEFEPMINERNKKDSVSPATQGENNSFFTVNNPLKNQKLMNYPNISQPFHPQTSNHAHQNSLHLQNNFNYPPSGNGQYWHQLQQPPASTQANISPINYAQYNPYLLQQKYPLPNSPQLNNVSYNQPIMQFGFLPTFLLDKKIIQSQIYQNSQVKKVDSTSQREIQTKQDDVQKNEQKYTEFNKNFQPQMMKGQMNPKFIRFESPFRKQKKKFVSAIKCKLISPKIQRPQDKSPHNPELNKINVSKQRKVTAISENNQKKLIEQGMKQIKLLPSTKILLTKNIQHKHEILKKYKHFVMYDKLLGKGTFGSVFLGFNLLTGINVAFKKIQIKKKKDLNQAECLRQISHPYIVKLEEEFQDETDKSYYMILEYCPENLKERLERLKRQSTCEREELVTKIRYAQMLIQGMNELNLKGIIHRDLKDQNILIKDEMIKIGDFGLARKLNKKLELDSIRCGTPHTMAPEIYFHPNKSELNPIYTFKADIYSIAVIFHQFLYENHPFDYEVDKLKQFDRTSGKGERQAKLRQIVHQHKLCAGWIDQIIEGGLKKVEERLDWTQVMTIYKNRLIKAEQICQNTKIQLFSKGAALSKKQNQQLLYESKYFMKIKPKQLPVSDLNLEIDQNNKNRDFLIDKKIEEQHRFKRQNKRQNQKENEQKENGLKEYGQKEKKLNPRQNQLDILQEAKKLFGRNKTKQQIKLTHQKYERHEIPKKYQNYGIFSSDYQSENEQNQNQIKFQNKIAQHYPRTRNKNANDNILQMSNKNQIKNQQTPQKKDLTFQKSKLTSSNNVIRPLIRNQINEQKKDVQKQITQIQPKEICKNLQSLQKKSSEKECKASSKEVSLKRLFQLIILLGLVYFFLFSILPQISMPTVKQILFTGREMIESCILYTNSQIQDSKQSNLI